MPIWFELLILLLITYTVGLALGWLLWAARTTEDEGAEA